MLSRPSRVTISTRRLLPLRLISPKSLKQFMKLAEPAQEVICFSSEHLAAYYLVSGTHQRV